MDAVNKLEYKIRELGTKSVTLFPTRAQIHREISGVALKPGTNEITIVGLSPTVDEHSVKVEGSGSAVISSIAVESLPNRDIFEDVYPDSDDDEPDAEDDDDEENDDQESDDMKAIKAKLVQLRDDMGRAKEAISSAENRLRILDAHGKTMDRKSTVNIADGLEVYKQERQKTFEDHVAGTREQREIELAIGEATKEQSRISRRDAKVKVQANKEKRKAQAAKVKEKLKLARREEERLKEKERIRAERQSFWPLYCYSVRITLEANVYTPMSSRRGSIASDSEIVLPGKTESPASSNDALVCDLLLSYVTSSAYWAPSYDLQLSTTSATAALCFDAQLNNHTSEKWENCHITLSTSQATFAGLEDAIPSLTPWEIKLTRKGYGNSDTAILNSREEDVHREAFKLKSAPHVKPREAMFGSRNAKGPIVDYQMQLMLLEQQNKQRLMMARADATGNNALMPQQQPQQQFHQSMQMPLPPMASMDDARRRSKKKSSVFGTMGDSATNAASSFAGALPARPTVPLPVAPAPRGGGRPSDEAQYEAYEADLVDDGTLRPEAEPGLDFEESLVEETGFTTAYDLPGVKSLVPKSTTSKQRVARITFANVVFSHTVVAKYKPVAYLKAKLRNNSKLTLLRGSAGLTLDGSFMGRTTLPRCSAGDIMTLGLGVDPALKVVYPKPDVRRATTGLFSKEDSSVYVRTVSVHNTRAAAGKPVTLLVLDQIPVSQDERLKVDLLSPRGLTPGGAGIAAGRPGRETAEDQTWGKATATLKKGGEVNWLVTLNAGKAVKLGLEYVVAMPSGESAVQC